MSIKPPVQASPGRHGREGLDPRHVVASFLTWSLNASLEYVWPDPASKEVRMQSRRQGSLQVSALGCLGISEFHGYERQSIATIARALYVGSAMLDTANVYGPFADERIVGRATPSHRGARGGT